jgi:outer membrane protein TolC
MLPRWIQLIFLRLFLLLLPSGEVFAAGESRPFPDGETITLEQAYDRALETDQAIRIAFFEVRKANLLPWSALTRLGPQISASGQYSRSERAVRSTVNEVTIGLGLESLSESVERTSHSRTGFGTAGFTVQQPLIDFTVFGAYQVGKLSSRITRLQHQFTIRETLYGVATAYYEVLKQQRLVYVNRETFRLAREQLDVARIRADVGEVTRSDVLRATVTVETARRDVVESENTLELNKNTLANILNLKPNTPFRVVEPPEYPTRLPSFDELLLRAYNHREDFRVEDLNIEQEIARRRQILGQYGPRLVAQFDGDIAHTTGTSTNSTRNWQATLSVQVPIFTGGQREIDLATAKYQIEQARVNRERVAKIVEDDVKRGWLAVRSLEQTLKALRAQVEAAEQSYTDLQNQYRAGTATSVDVLTALTDLNAARRDLAVQIYQYQVALRNLEQASGVFQDSRVNKAKIP